MTNLLNETIEEIENYDLKIKDIIFIGSSDGKYSCTWNEFECIADKEYSSGFGWQEVASDLVIVFKDKSQLIRTEYDGSESWKIITIPTPAIKTKKITRLINRDLGWDTISEMNSKEK